MEAARSESVCHQDAPEFQDVGIMIVFVWLLHGCFSSLDLSFGTPVSLLLLLSLSLLLLLVCFVVVVIVVVVVGLFCFCCCRCCWFVLFLLFE